MLLGGTDAAEALGTTEFSVFRQSRHVPWYNASNGLACMEDNPNGRNSQITAIFHESANPSRCHSVVYVWWQSRLRVYVAQALDSVFGQEHIIHGALSVAHLRNLIAVREGNGTSTHISVRVRLRTQQSRYAASLK